MLNQYFSPDNVDYYGLEWKPDNRLGPHDKGNFATLMLSGTKPVGHAEDYETDIIEALAPAVESGQLCLQIIHGISVYNNPEGVNYFYYQPGREADVEELLRITKEAWGKNHFSDQTIRRIGEIFGYTPEEIDYYFENRENLRRHQWQQREEQKQRYESLGFFEKCRLHFNKIAKDVIDPVAYTSGDNAIKAYNIYYSLRRTVAAGTHPSEARPYPAITPEVSRDFLRGTGIHYDMQHDWERYKKFNPEEAAKTEERIGKPTENPYLPEKKTFFS